MNKNEIMRDDEISFYDFVQPLLENSKFIAITALIGLLVGTIGWWIKGYDAELKAKTVAKLDFVEWRRISLGLPALAESRVAIRESAGSDASLYRALSSSEWWTKNVIPQYRYSKNDIKELGAISKDEQEEGATIIESVVFRGKSQDRSEAVVMALGVEHLVREGGLMLALKSIIARRDFDTRRVSTEVQAKISRDEVELGYLNKRASLLKKLAQQYPDKQINTLQAVLDPKDNTARYLPVGTQLIAVETEINSLEESLSRSRDRLEAAGVSRAFVERSQPLLKSDPEGFELAKELEAIEADIRKGINSANKAQRAEIDEIARELNSAHERFKSMFEFDGLASVRRSAQGLLLTLGLVGGGLSGIVFVFVSTAWRRAGRRERSVS